MTKQFLQIQSKGIIDNKAMTLIGASTKTKDDSKIGQFGSGLNYSIASLVRQDIPFLIFKGNEEIKIGTKPVDFKDETFNVILIDGKETSFTDTMGAKDWVGAFPFIREIYANALDEDENATIKLVENIEMKDGYTTFIIEATEEVTEVINNFSSYFCKDETSLFKDEKKGSIHPKTESVVVFRHGIQAYKNSNLQSIFNYDLNEVGVNESRVIKDQYEMRRAVGYLLESMTDKRLIQRWIVGMATATERLFEHDCCLYDFLGTVSNPVLVEYLLETKFYPLSFQEELEPKDMKGRYGLPMNSIRRLLKYAPDMDVLGITVNKETEQAKEFIEKTPTMTLFNLVAHALEKLKSSDYDERLSSKVKYCKFQSSLTLGYADVGKDTIWLSTKLDTYSVDEIAKIIIEEQEHLITGFDDCTRNFQNHLFNLYFSQLIKS